MKTSGLVLAACLLVGAGAAPADTLVVNNQLEVRPSDIDRPARGSTMHQVEERFGEPTLRHATVGDPPITRWDYPHFAVFFERNLVIHAVVTGE